MLISKEKLHQTCIQTVKEKLNTIKQLIDFANQASTDDTKSSAGDKFETTREMMQQELDRLFKQLNEANKSLITLNNINPLINQKSVKTGALVLTDKGNFYIAVSLGSMKTGDLQTMVISDVSPIAKSMLGLKTGMHFTFNKMAYQIANIV